MRLLVLVILCITALPALAEKRVALVIGNDRYEAMRPLRNAANDADTVGAALEALGFEVAYERDRDKRRMERALEDLEYDGEGADVAVVYFAGHGFEVGGDNRLLPVDGDGESLESLMETSLSLGEIRARVAKIAPVAVVLVDACRVDPFEGATDGRAAIALKAGETPGFAAVARAEGTLIGFSTAPGAVALDGEGSNSPFAAALARHLETPGLEVRSVLTLVQQEVYDRTRGAQLPYVESALPRLFFAAGQSDALPERERLLLAMADLTPDLRAEVERVATDAQVPLAPIYGALLAAELTEASPTERAEKLAEAARAFNDTQAQLRALSASDGEVAELRDVADSQLSLGDFTGALDTLDEAIARDRASGDALAENLVARRLSEADTLVLKAGFARTRLDYAQAIEALARASALHVELAGLVTDVAHRRARVEVARELGELRRITGDGPGARAAFDEMLTAAKVLLVIAPSEEAALLVFQAQMEIGYAQMAAADFGGAIDSFATAIDALRATDQTGKLHELNMWAAEVAVGDTAMALGSYRSALRSYTTANERITKALPEMPEDAEERLKLATSYERLGDAQMALGLSEEAFDTYWKGFDSVGNWGTVTKGDPALRSRMMLRIGQIGTKAGRAALVNKEFATALAYLERMVEFLRTAYEEDPQQVEMQQRYAAALASLGDAQMRHSDHAAASKSLTQAIALLEPLIALDPGNANYRYELALAWSLYGEQQVVDQQWDSALEYLAAAIGAMDDLFEINSSNAIWLWEYADMHQRRGRLAEQRERFAVAMEDYAVAARYSGIMSEFQADSPQGRTRHAQNLFYLGNMQITLGQWEQAAATQSELVALLERIAVEEPGNIMRVGELAMAQLRLGDAQGWLGQDAAAAEGFAAALEGFDAVLAERYDYNAWYWAAKTEEVWAEMERRYGRGEEALAHHREALRRREGLLEKRDNRWHIGHLVGLSHEQIGTVLAELGRKEEAIAAHRRAMEIRKALLLEIPQDMGITRTLFVSHFLLAELGDAPVQNYRAAVEVLDRMEARGALSEEDAGWRDDIRTRIAALEAEKNPEKQP
ncbi:caspase family protein [Vannielia litorea]|uniref:caspase family protein n=1 Tax=Vannielia litorea TaxID=1217970 RepID=UPI001C94AEC9|nr:caspase family protein [Vannielia litorea]MBY6049955.1 caspase family protein [Vannielia litorea]MBY6077369.1 caspase family protein [Vannielia litorea]